MPVDANGRLNVLMVDSEKTWHGGEAQLRLLMAGLIEEGVHVELAAAPESEMYHVKPPPPEHSAQTPGRHHVHTASDGDGMECYAQITRPAIDLATRRGGQLNVHPFLQKAGHQKPQLSFSSTPGLLRVHHENV